MLLAGSAAAHAQVSPHLTVTLQQTGGNPGAVVAVAELLADDRFLKAVESGFPLRLDFRLELRERRSSWFDRSVGGFNWDYVIVYDAVRDQYVLDDGNEALVFSSRRQLRRRVETRYDAGSYPPDRDGEFYYRATLDAVTLSDEDVDEVYEWLRGEAGGGGRGTRRPGRVTRMARRLLVQVAPLPRERLTANSPTFRWP